MKVSQSHFDAAVSLAKAIKEDTRWTEWNTAMEAADNDAELSALIMHHKELSALNQKGQGDMGEIKKVEGQIRRLPSYQQQEDATEAMIGLLREVNVTLSEELGLEFASAAAPKKSGGCCGC
jgi:hypothetical protein